jgi:UDP-glucose 4-epimerase
MIGSPGRGGYLAAVRDSGRHGRCAFTTDIHDDGTQMPLRRIAITGSSGAYGCGVIRAIRRRHPDAVILGLDVRAPASDPPDRFRRTDVLSGRMTDEIRAFRPDTMIHLAFVVNPIHDDALMGRINLEGTQNFLEAARACRPERVLVSSSATAYGAWPDNPVPMDEDAPIRARHEFRYSADKVAVETLVSRFAEAEPDIAVSWTRPAIIFTPGVSNYLVKFIVNAKVIVLPGGDDATIQFVHIEDVSLATLTLLERDARGPYNVSPEDWVTLRTLARLTGRPVASVPFALCRAWSKVWWACHLPWFRSPAGLWYFIRYPWVVTSAKLARDHGFRFRHTCLETLTLLLQAKGQLSGPDPRTDAGKLALGGARDAIASSSQSAAGRR